MHVTSLPPYLYTEVCHVRVCQSATWQRQITNVLPTTLHQTHQPPALARYCEVQWIDRQGKDTIKLQSC